MADKKDPTVRSASPADSYPDGTHPAVRVDAGADAASAKEYKEMPGKPDKTTIAQVEIRPDEK